MKIIFYQDLFFQPQTLLVFKLFLSFSAKALYKNLYYNFLQYILKKTHKKPKLKKYIYLNFKYKIFTLFPCSNFPYYQLNFQIASFVK